MISRVYLKPFYILIFLIFLLLSWGTLASEFDLTKDEVDYINKNPLIRVHAEEAWRPFNFIENNEVKGYSNDLIRLVANNVGLEIKFVTGYHWYDYMSMLKNGEIDVITNIKVTPKRENYVIFTQYHPLKVIDGLLTLEGTSHYLDFEYLKNKRVAIVRGTFYEELMKTHFPEINLQLTNTTEESVEQLILGNVDAVLDSYAVINFYIQRYFITGVTNSPLLESEVFNNLPQYMGVNKNNPMLRSILNKGLQKVSNGQLARLRQYWLLSEKKMSTFIDNGFQQVMPLFTEDERQYLKSKKKLKMCVDPDGLPIEGIRDGIYSGMGADFVHLFKQRISTPIELVKTDSWSQTLDYMQRGLCDFIPIIRHTEHRSKFLTFTSPYLHFPLVLVTKKEYFIHKLDDVLHKAIGIVKGHSYKEVFDKHYPNGVLREYASVEAGLSAVKKGEIYSFIGSLPVMADQVQKHYPELTIADKLDYINNLSLATSLNEPLLVNIFNKVIASISVIQQEEIVSRWLPLAYEKKQDQRWLWCVFVIVFIALLLLVFRNKMLKKSNIKLRDMHDQLEELAMRDFLTGLPNRHYFLTQLNNEWSRSSRSKLPISVVMVDIDHFKRFNGLYGRLAGDSCLLEFSRRLKSTIKRSADMLARYDGEEFVLILPDTDERGVQSIVIELFHILEQWALPHEDSPNAKTLTVSIGSATMTYNNKYIAEELVRRADNALYKAQQKGYNQLIQYQKKQADY